MAYVYLVRLHRPIGIFLLMWPALWALWLAGEGSPPWPIVLIFVARGGADALGRLRHQRLRGPGLRRPRGPHQSASAGDRGWSAPGRRWRVFVVLSLVAFGLVLFLNWQTVALSRGGGGC